MLDFDHTYTNDDNYRFLKKLEKYGFKLMDSETEHPGKHFCRFIGFTENPLRRRQYIEFVKVKKNGIKITKPGVSFGCTKELKSYFEKIKDKLPAKYEHKNYNWKEDNKNYNPGWNFVTFKKVKLKGLVPWITEYEKPANAKRKKRPRIIHPNGVQRILGLHYDLDEAGVKFFEELLGKKIKDKVKLSCGTIFHFNKAKKTKLNFIHLECKNLKKLKVDFYYDEEMKFFGNDACVINNPNMMWNLVITQKKKK